MTIREAKFGKYRRLPVHATTVTALRDYAETRAQSCPRPRGPRFFVSTGTPPCRLDLADLDADLDAAFLTHLERDRRNGVRTRNARLAGIHSLFRYAALRHPEHAESIARVLAISAAATTPCWSWPSRPGCGSASSPRSPPPTCTSTMARTSDATVRAARNGRHR